MSSAYLPTYAAVPGNPRLSILPHRLHDETSPQRRSHTCKVCHIFSASGRIVIRLVSLILIGNIGWVRLWSLDGEVDYLCR